MTAVPGMSARATAGREVYARTFAVAPAEAGRIMTEHAGDGGGPPWTVLNRPGERP